MAGSAKAVEHNHHTQRSVMNLHHLLVFHTIAKTGSITSSAKQLNIS
jgi:hypothetical protein